MEKPLTLEEAKDKIREIQAKLLDITTRLHELEESIDQLKHDSSNNLIIRNMDWLKYNQKIYLNIYFLFQRQMQMTMLRRSLLKSKKKRKKCIKKRLFC